MKLHGRTTQPGDIEQCLGLLRDRFLYTEGELDHIRVLWLSLLVGDVARSAIVFHEEEPLRVLAFGFAAPVNEWRFGHILNDPAPFIAKSLLAEWSSDRSPFLDESGFAAANASDGLNMLVLHNGLSETVGASDFAQVLSVLSEAFLTQQAGCRMKAVIHESFGIPIRFAIELGMQSIDFAQEHCVKLAECPPHRKPAIVLATRDYAEQHPGNLTLNRLFLRFTAPRCSLNSTQRRLLRFAIEGESDESIAELLTLAPRTLKKRWADIYAAMESVTGVLSGGLAGHRGVEVRRHVLHYVRRHPEELHAYASATSNRATGARSVSR